MGLSDSDDEPVVKLTGKKNLEAAALRMKRTVQCKLITSPTEEPAFIKDGAMMAVEEDAAQPRKSTTAFDARNMRRKDTRDNEGNVVMKGLETKIKEAGLSVEKDFKRLNLTELKLWCKEQFMKLHEHEETCLQDFALLH